MTNDRRNAFTRHTGNDTLLNGALIAIVIVGLLIAVLDGPIPAMGTGNVAVASSRTVTSGHESDWARVAGPAALARDAVRLI